MCAVGSSKKIIYLEKFTFRPTKIVKFKASNTLVFLRLNPIQVCVYWISTFVCSFDLCVYVLCVPPFPLSVISYVHFYMPCLEHMLPAYRLWWPHHIVIILVVRVSVDVCQLLSKSPLC